MRHILAEGLPALGADPSCAEALVSFARMLLEKNQVMNLTAITDPGDVATLHLLDSLSLLGAAELEGKRLIDVGTGAGFPGVPLAIARRSCQVTLLDSLNKRVDFLRETCAALGLENTTCVHARAEEYARDHREQFDIAASRAVADLRLLAELCLPLVAAGGVFLAMKSVDCEEELAGAKNAIKLLGGKTERVIDYPIPTTDVVHRVVVIRKLSPTPAKYPRRFAQMKKQPL